MRVKAGMFAAASVLVLLTMGLGAPTPAEAAPPGDSATKNGTGPVVAEDGVPSCPDRTFVAGLGPACRQPDGLLLVHDETGRPLGTTHGHDPIPVDGHSTPPTRHPLRCTDPVWRPYHTLLIVAEPSDGGRIGITDAKLIELAEQANGAFREAATRHGHTRSIFTVCDPDGSPSIIRVTLPTRLDRTTFSTVSDDLFLMGFTDTRVKHWVWFDGQISCGCSGTANLYGDDDHEVVNNNNGNGLFISVAVTWGRYAWSTMAHELAHNLGAVQNSAPHTSGSGHCNDGYDIMCYNDGGPTSSYSSGVCAAPERFDCGSDDYFHPAPAGGSYLATHWNVGDPYVRYLLGCYDVAGHMWAGAGSIPIPGYTYDDWTMPSCAAGKRFVLEAYPHQVDASRFIYDIDICFYAADGSSLPCYQDFGHLEEGEVPSGAASARVYTWYGAHFRYSLRIG